MPAIIRPHPVSDSSKYADLFNAPSPVRHPLGHLTQPQGSSWPAVLHERMFLVHLIYLLDLFTPCNGLVPLALAQVLIPQVMQDPARPSDAHSTRHDKCADWGTYRTGSGIPPRRPPRLETGRGGLEPRRALADEYGWTGRIGGMAWLPIPPPGPGRYGHHRIELSETPATD